MESLFLIIIIFFITVGIKMPEFLILGMIGLFLAIVSKIKAEIDFGW